MTRIEPAVHRDRPADDARVGAETPRPQSVAEDRLARTAEVVVAGREAAAKRRLRAHHVEEVGRHHGAAQLFRILPAEERAQRAVVGRERLDAGALRAPVLEPRVRRDVAIEALLGVLHPHHHDAIRVPVGKLAQQERLDDAEDGGVGSDAERQRQERGEREPLRVSQGPECMPEVVQHEPRVLPGRLEKNARDRLEPHEHRGATARVTQAVGEEPPQLASVLVAKARRVEVQRRREGREQRPCHARLPRRPVARASASSRSRRRASTSATLRPSRVKR